METGDGKYSSSLEHKRKRTTSLSLLGEIISKRMKSIHSQKIFIQHRIWKYYFDEVRVLKTTAILVGLWKIEIMVKFPARDCQSWTKLFPPLQLDSDSVHVFKCVMHIFHSHTGLPFTLNRFADWVLPINFSIVWKQMQPLYKSFKMALRSHYHQHRTFSHMQQMT